MFDGEVRDLLEAGSPSGRHRADTASDVTAWVPWALVAADLVGRWKPSKPNVEALSSAVRAGEAFALNLAVTAGLKAAVGRERPLVAPCRADPAYARACADLEPNESFPGGHTSAAFTGAGLVCFAGSWAGPWPTRTGHRLACALGLAAATATAALRIVADQHYATDVVAGAAAGLSSAYFAARPARGRTVEARPWAGRRSAGLSLAVSW